MPKQKKNKKIEVQGAEITVVRNQDQDYISLTDMVRDIDNGLALIEKWLRNKNTIEFLGIWEELYNPSFNSLEFEGIKNQAGLNRFILSVKQWVNKTNSIGIIAKAGRYDGTYAHKDIAFEFASWVSPKFKITGYPFRASRLQDSQCRLVLSGSCLKCWVSLTLSFNEFFSCIKA